jgi:hypothetical protein
MPAQRLIRILGLLAAKDGTEPRKLCQVAAEVTGMSGAAVMLLADDRPQASLCSTDAVSALIEEFQYTLGEGPGVDAHRLGQVVAVPDLAGLTPGRWTDFTPRALHAGARAVFGFPIRAGVARMGALNLYRDRTGPMDDEQHADALVSADVTARSILTAQANAVSGELGPDLEAETELWGAVHQAAGMVSVQLDIPVAEALVRLRAYAFATGRVVSDVARDVVERNLRFDGEG